MEAQEEEREVEEVEDLLEYYLQRASTTQSEVRARRAALCCAVLCCAVLCCAVL